VMRAFSRAYPPANECDRYRPMAEVVLQSIDSSIRGGAEIARLMMPLLSSPPG
jgi:hypothetical protein